MRAVLISKVLSIYSYQPILINLFSQSGGATHRLAPKQIMAMLIYVIVYWGVALVCANF